MQDTPPVSHAIGERQIDASRLVRAYLWSEVQKIRLIRLIRSLFTGFWLGVLSRSDLDAVDDAYYVGLGRKRSSPIDYASPEYNKRGLFEWERKAIENHFPPSGSIGLMAAGGGREVLALRRMSYLVEAWECQPELVSAANGLLTVEGFEPSVSYAPRDMAAAGARTYDALILGWSSYMLIPGRDRRIALLRTLRARVGEGAPILLSFFTRRPGDTYLRIAAGVANLFRRLLGRERVQVGDLLEPNFVHRFTEDEIASELAAGGFDLEAFVAAPYGHAVGLARSPDAKPAINGG